MENTGEAIWKSFSEKGIVLAGIDGPEYQAFFQSLVRVSQTSRARLSRAGWRGECAGWGLCAFVCTPDDSGTSAVSTAETERGRGQETAGGREKRKQRLEHAV